MSTEEEKVGGQSGEDGILLLKSGCNDSLRSMRDPMSPNDMFLVSWCFSQQV